MHALAEQNFDTFELFTAVLPVEYERAWPVLEQFLHATKPDYVLCIGQAEGRSAVSIETTARNLDDAKIADNAGVLRHNNPISIDGPAERATTLPVQDLIAAVTALGIAAESSDTAGTFLCNHIFFRVQEALAGTSARSGFIHVPLMSEQAVDFPGLPTMPLTEMVTAIEAVLIQLVGTLGNR